MIYFGVMLTRVSVIFDIVFGASFTPILTFPHRGGRDFYPSPPAFAGAGSNPPLEGEGTIVAGLADGYAEAAHGAGGC